MKIHEIAAFLGLADDHVFARTIGVRVSNLRVYLHGKRGHVPTIVDKIKTILSMNYEELYFPSLIDHLMAENPEHPAYYANLAAEAIRQAEMRGLPNAQSITALIVEAGRDTLDWNALDEALFTAAQPDGQP
jgi:hypothetical protein